ncbi:MAG: chromosome segregation protein SMC, partial [Clostridia bacterium]
MYLKALEIQGFKSFPDKIKLDIPKGLTAVVGPNGSGKSNVSDSIRWVLGEQSTKSLRGDKMEDIVFNGTSDLVGSKKRKPSGFAEVSIIIDNNDNSLDVEATEVKITRKYYRTGESEYLINNQAVRLTDVKQLFMDTGLGGGGYSMIGQGKIDEIIKSKPTDRRAIFEEAAGIAKFRFRKEQAQRKLVQTEENLIRLRDILGELEQRVGPLKEQSDKAEEFLKYAEEKKKIEISLWIEKIDSIKQQLREQDNKIFVQKTEYDQTLQVFDQCEEQIADIYKQMENKLTQIEKVRAEKKQFEENVSSYNEKIAVLNNDVLHNNQQIERIQSERDLISSSSDQTEKIVQTNNQRVLQLTQRREELSQKVLQTEKQLQDVSEKSADFSERIADVTTQINNQTNLLSNAKVMVASFQTTKDEIKIRFEKIIQDIEQRTFAKEKFEKDILQTKALIENYSQRKQENQNAKAGYSEILKTKEQKLLNARESIEKLVLSADRDKNKAKILNDMEKNMEGFAYSVKFVLSRVKEGMLKGIYGPVFRLIQTEEKYNIAIETALGAAMQNIICESENDAKQAIYALKKADSGRATFLPVSNVKGTKIINPKLEECDGFVGIASSLPQYDAKFEGIILALLGRCVIAEDFDSGALIAKKFDYKFKVVTLDGQVIHAGGSLTGGSNNKNTGLLSRKSEIEKLEKRIVETNSQIENEKKSFTPLAQEIGTIKSNLVAVENDIITLNEEIIKNQGIVNSLEKQMEDNCEILNNLINEQSVSKIRLEKLKKEKAEFENSISIATEKIEKLEQEIEQSSGSKINLKEQRNTLFENLNELRMTVLEIEKDIQNLEKTNSILQEKKQDENTKIELFTKQLKEIENQNEIIVLKINDFNKEIEKSTETVKKFDDKVIEISKQRIEIEGNTTLIKQKQKEVNDKKENLSRELTRLEERKISMTEEIDVLINNLLDEYELSLTDAYEIAEKIDSIQKAQRDVNSLKLKIKALGSINVAAIEEYKEVKERYDFLNTQINDVEKSKKELENLIDDLSSTMKKIFIDEFYKINENFSKIFINLFGGGHGELKITDQTDVLNSGIEIIVAPPGKVINNISSLSGGEHALIAVSIYFA